MYDLDFRIPNLIDAANNLIRELENGDLTTKTVGRAMKCVILLCRYCDYASGRSLAVSGVQAARRKGGESTRRLTPEIEQFARDMIAEQLAAGVSKTGACTRVAPEIFKRFGLKTSRDTLLRLLRRRKRK
jgi:hypothetical protein